MTHQDASWQNCYLWPLFYNKLISMHLCTVSMNFCAKNTTWLIMTHFDAPWRNFAKLLFLASSSFKPHFLFISGPFSYHFRAKDMTPLDATWRNFVKNANSRLYFHKNSFQSISGPFLWHFCATDVMTQHDAPWRNMTHHDATSQNRNFKLHFSSKHISWHLNLVFKAFLSLSSHDATWRTLTHLDTTSKNIYFKLYSNQNSFPDN